MRPWSRSWKLWKPSFATLRHCGRSLRTVLVGVLLLLLFLGLFVYRLSAHFNQTYVQALRDDAQRRELITQLMEESKAKSIIEEQANMFATQLWGEVLPTMQEKLTQEIVANRPRAEKMVLEMGDRLSAHMQRSIEGRLSESLTKGIENMGGELQRIFPDTSAKELQNQIEHSQGVFIEKLHEAIEDRIALVAASLEQLKAQIREMAQENIREQRTIEEVESLFLEDLVDLLVYELKPELGNEKAK